MFGIDVPGCRRPAWATTSWATTGMFRRAASVRASARSPVACRAPSNTRSLVRDGTQVTNPAFLMLRMPSSGPLRAGRIHDVATSIETDVPETSTRVVILYRVSNAFAHRPVDEGAGLDSRFGVQVHQSLPFLDFSTAKWEMLLGVRNFFRETSAGSVGLRRVARRPPAQADCGRLDDAVLELSLQLDQIHNIEWDILSIGLSRRSAHRFLLITRYFSVS